MTFQSLKMPINVSHCQICSMMRLYEAALLFHRLPCKCETREPDKKAIGKLVTELFDDLHSA